MNETEFMDTLMATLDEALDEEVRSVRTFEDVGMLTRDHGLVVTMVDGTEFQVTVLQSRGPRG